MGAENVAITYGGESYPQVLIQFTDTKFYLLAKGYTSYDDLAKRIENVIAENA
jgi:putative protein-disulfide isomerase